MEPASFVPKALKLAPKEAVLRGVQFRTQKRVVPAGGQNGYSPSNNQIEFLFTDGEGISLVDTAVRFEASFLNGAGSADASGSVVSAADFVERVEFYIGQTSILSTTVSRVRNVVNAMMKNELSEDWFKYAGKNLLGWNSYGLNREPTLDSSAVINGWKIPEHNGDRTYIVPLWCLHPALLAPHLPVVGEQIRIVLTLAQPAACLATRTADASTYQLDNVELHVEHIQYEREYKQSLMSQMSGSEGFTIPMIDFDIQRQSFSSNDIAFTQRNQRSNCLSLVIFNAKTDAGRRDKFNYGTGANPAKKTHSDPTLHCDVGLLTTNLKVFSGDRHFTPLNGVESNAELLSNLERVAGGFGKEDNGTISWDEYTHETSQAAANYVPHAPIMISLERTQMDDTDYQVMNRGLSAYDPLVDADIQVQLKTASTDHRKLDTSRDELYSCLVYEKTLVFADGAISVDA